MHTNGNDFVIIDNRVKSYKFKQSELSKLSHRNTGIGFDQLIFLEESKNKVIFPLPVGSTIFSNNYFWLHGRKAFNEHSGLSRELLRIRGTFFN